MERTTQGLVVFVYVFDLSSPIGDTGCADRKRYGDYCPDCLYVCVRFSKYAVFSFTSLREFLRAQFAIRSREESE